MRLIPRIPNIQAFLFLDLLPVQYSDQKRKLIAWMVTIVIVDQSLPNDSSHNGDELCAMNVNIFRKSCEGLSQMPTSW
jgi:hypothetical protein